MGFLDNLLNRNPTKDWRAEPGLALVLNLDDESFCGIRIGDRADRLQKLGPASNAQLARSGMYEYGDKGFLVTAEQGRFVEVELTFAGEPGAFAGTIRRHGRDGTLSGGASEKDVIALLGPADERSDDEATEYSPPSAMLSWHLNRTTCQVTFDDGRLTEIWLGSKH